MAIKGENRRLGFSGERKAVRFLKRNGYKILEKNYKCLFGEVDIIAASKDVIVFCEVKTRTGISYGMPNEAVGRERQRRYINCARYYFSGRQMDCTVRFDIIEILDGRINHIVSAFTA